jgi:hypothetical protein
LKDAKTLYLCPIWMWEAIYRGLLPQPKHHGIISTQQLPRIAKNLTLLRQCNGERVHSYAYVPHKKKEKHLIHVHYECGKQSKVDYSLNHGIIASFPLDSHPELLKNNHSGFSGVTV